MPQLATRAQDVPDVFATHFNTHDSRTLAAMYEPDAVFVAPDGALATGTEEIIAANDAFLSLRIPITVRLRGHYATATTALLIVDWVIDGHDPAGSPVRVEATATDVARRGADGYWRYCVDNPFSLPRA